MTNPDSQPTADKRRLADARRRFGRLMKLMFGASLVVVLVAFAGLYATGTPMPLPFLGAIALAVIGSLMLAAALMGLVFFSAASGADDAVDKHDPTGRP
jgi:protein-S-isoprenylcysteine O-methyltransferase Ste14